MGSNSTSTAGGGNATPTASAFNQFMLNGLQNGSFGNANNPQQSAPTPSTPYTNTDRRSQPSIMAAGGGPINGQGHFNTDANGNPISGPTNQDPFSGEVLRPTSFIPGSNQPRPNQGNGNFGDAINGLLGGNNQLGPNPFGNMIQGNGMVNNLPNAPGFQNTDFSQLGTNLDLSGYQNGGQTLNYNSLGMNGTLANGGGPGFGGFNLNAPQATEFSSGGGLQGQYGALLQQQDRNKQAGLAQLNARFGASGAGALGSGAQYASGNYLANQGSQDILAQGQLQNQFFNQDLANRNLNIQGQLGAGGINAQLANTAMQGQSSLNNSLVNQQGNQLNYLMSQGNLGLQNAQLGQQGALQQFLANTGNQQQNNMNQFNQNTQQNQFNQQNYSSNLQALLANQGLGNQFALGAYGLGNQQQQLQQQQQQMNQQGQLGILSQLFGSYNNINSIGTPQAQVVQHPNQWAQGLGALGQGLGGYMAGGGSFNFGGGGSNGGYGGLPQGGSPTSDYGTRI